VTCYVSESPAGPWKYVGMVLSRRDIARGLVKQAIAEKKASKRGGNDGATGNDRGRGSDGGDDTLWKALRLDTTSDSESAFASSSSSSIGRTAYEDCNPVTWKRCPSPPLSPGLRLIMERPKVIFNRHTGMYVLWLHLDISAAKSGGNKGGKSRRSSKASERGEYRRRRLHSSDDDVDVVDEEEDDDNDDDDDNVEMDDDVATGIDYVTANGTTHQGHSPSSVLSSHLSSASAVSPHLLSRPADTAAVRPSRPAGRRKKYFFRRAGVAFANRPEGPFVFLHAILPDGESSLDLQLFQEHDEGHDNTRSGSLATMGVSPPPLSALPAYLIRSVDNQYVVSALRKRFRCGTSARPMLTYICFLRTPSVLLVRPSASSPKTT
jgi:hypothetical protein